MNNYSHAYRILICCSFLLFSQIHFGQDLAQWLDFKGNQEIEVAEIKNQFSTHLNQLDILKTIFVPSEGDELFLTSEQESLFIFFYLPRTAGWKANLSIDREGIGANNKRFSKRPRQSTSFGKRVLESKL